MARLGLLRLRGSGCGSSKPADTVVVSAVKTPAAVVTPPPTQPSSPAPAKQQSKPQMPIPMMMVPPSTSDAAAPKKLDPLQEALQKRLAKRATAETVVESNAKPKASSDSDLYAALSRPKAAKGRRPPKSKKGSSAALTVASESMSDKI